ncbi:hypothetical protein [Escherichia coli]
MTKAQTLASVGFAEEVINGYRLLDAGIVSGAAGLSTDCAVISSA